MAQRMDYLRRLVRRLVGIGAQKVEAEAQPAFFVPPGHFYSPWPDPIDAERVVANSEHSMPAMLDGIWIDDPAMQRMWIELTTFMQSAPFPRIKDNAHRYYLALIGIDVGPRDLPAKSHSEVAELT